MTVDQLYDFATRAVTDGKISVKSVQDALPRYLGIRSISELSQGQRDIVKTILDNKIRPGSAWIGNSLSNFYKGESE